MRDSPAHILVVEDDAVTRSKLAGYFQAEGYRVSEAEDAEVAWRFLDGHDVDLILLDINLPGEDGLYLTRQIRARLDVGIILVTGRTHDVDRIVGLEIGADDYVTKPFNQRELLARVKNLLRRVAASVPPEEVSCRIGDWSFDMRRRQLVAAGGAIMPLTRAEFELLSALVRHPHVVMTRDRLLSQVTHRQWDPSDRTIDVLVRRLRNKIEPDPKLPQYIVTVHGEGYLFATDRA